MLSNAFVFLFRKLMRIDSIETHDIHSTFEIGKIQMQTKCQHNVSNIYDWTEKKIAATV